MPFAKRGDVVHSEAASGFNNQKKSLLINGLAALGDSLRPLHLCSTSLISLKFIELRANRRVSPPTKDSYTWPNATTSTAVRAESMSFA